MAFLLSAVERDLSCTSQILLDGVYISAAALLKERREAQLEIYPCQSYCCGGNSSTPIYTVRPLKLHILLPKPSCFEFSLSRGDKTLLTRKERLLIPVLSNTMRTSLVFCVVSLAKCTGSLRVSLSTDQGIYKSVRLNPEWRLHEPCLLTHIQLDASAPLSKSGSSVKRSSRRPERVLWIWQDLSKSTSGVAQQNCISFDDRKATKRGLTGACQWHGLTPDQNINVCKLKFWVTNDTISGFQATYVIDEIQTVGPRNRFDNAHHIHHPRIFELHEGENVSCVQGFKNLEGLIVQLSIVTDRGRSFSVGPEGYLVQGKAKTLLRHPNARVVGFRGSFKGGLTEFGFLLEFDEPDLRGLPEGYKCFVCGALYAYFADMTLFLVHVENCVLDLMFSHQGASPHSYAVM